MSSRAAPYAAVALLAALAWALGVQPWAEPLPQRDSGLFLYAGQQLLAGHVPYRDIWDHKGPLIYALNALGLGLGSGVRGVQALELLALVAAALLAFDLMQRVAGRTLALTLSAVWLATLVPLSEGGNLTEGYSLPLQFLALWLWFREQARPRVWHLLLIGVTFGALFLLRPNNAAIPLAISLWLVGETLAGRGRTPLRKLLALLLGLGLVVLPTLGYLAAQGALTEAVEAVGRFNLVYSDTLLTRRLYSVVYGFGLLRVAPALTALLMVGALLWLLDRRRGDNRADDPTSTPFFRFLLLAFALEAGFSALSGNFYPHYFLLWLPPLTLILAHLAARAAQTLEPRATLPPHAPFWPLLLLLYALLCQLPPPGGAARQAAQRAHDEQLSAAVAFAAREVPPHAPLLVWGSEAAVNFLSQRPAPTRYVYQRPLHTCGYTTPMMIQEFVRDVEAARPLLLDSSPTNPAIPPLDATARAQWATERDPCGLVAGLEPLFALLAQEYEGGPTVGPGAWRVYRPRGR